MNIKCKVLQRFQLLTIIFLMIALFVCRIPVSAQTDVVGITSPSAILMEASTGKVIYEKNADEIRSPASITKIMTLLLIFDAIENRQIKLEDQVTTSAYAKSMGGSQVFLEEGEIQTVDTLIKCIAIASGNDASVVMAEYIAGSEEAFVQKMNEKAKQLQMTQTQFVDCCGLSNNDEHHTTARDVAIMSRELISKYPQVFDYTQIWMEDMIHETRQGTKTFTLSSTNKLLKQYQWTTGLKTGSTQKAKYCLSATAQKDNISLIAVIMGASDFKIRFAEAKKLLEYGYQVAHLFQDSKTNYTGELPVVGGVTSMVAYQGKEDFSYLDTEGTDFSQIEKKWELPEAIEAPIEEGDTIGTLQYLLHGTPIGVMELISLEKVERANLFDFMKRIYQTLIF